MPNKFICYRCGACGGEDKIKNFKVLNFSTTGGVCRYRLCAACVDVLKNLKFKCEVDE